MEPQFIFIGNGNKFINNMYKDFFESDRITSYGAFLILPNKLRSKIVGASARLVNVELLDYVLFVINKVFGILERIKLNQKTYVVFHNSTMMGMSWRYFRRYLNKNKNCVPVIIFADQTFRISGVCAKKIADICPECICLTFDPEDAKKYNYKFIYEIYSKFNVKSSDITEDVYYVGSAIGRLNTIENIAEYLYKHGCKININAANTKHVTKKSYVNYLNKHKPYELVVSDLQSCNCILDVVQEGQYGVSLRFYEAVCYNKKLLTNNKNIVNLPFYNSEYMHIYEKPEDIDCEWVKERIPIDYGYDGRFSPINLLDKIVELDKERRKEICKKIN